MLMPPRRRRSSTALIHVPRPTPPWTVVLHSSARRDPNAAVVLYNPAERRLAVQRNANDHHGHSAELYPTPERCPLCRRPWGSNTATTPGVGADGGGEADVRASMEDYMDAHGRGVSDAEYFGLLALVAPESVSETDSNVSDGEDDTNSRAGADPGRRRTGSLPSASLSTPGSGGAAADSSSNLHASSFNQGYYDRFFVEERKLGRGLRGSVFLCQHVLDQVPLGQFAVKAIPVGTSHAWLVRMLKEVHLLERLRHPNITQYKHAWLEHRQLTQFGPEVPCLFILMALANGGNLEEYIYVQWHPEPAAAASNQQDGEAPSDSADDSDFPPHLTARQRAIRARDRKRRRLSASVKTAAANAAGASTATSTLPHSATEGSEEHAAAKNSETSPLSQTRPPPPRASTRAQLYGGIGRATPRGKKVRYLSTPVVWCLFLDICKGLSHLHDHNIVHRDLKPPNLLLQYADPTERQSEIPRVLISDFGECEVVDETRPTTTTTAMHAGNEIKPDRTGATGTLEFMAPELLDRDPETGKLRADPHSPAADLWSLGVVLYFLCYADVPYSQIDDVDVLREEILAFRSVTFPDHGLRISPELQTLIVRLMSRDPRARPSAREILDMHGHLGAPPVPGHFQSQQAQQQQQPQQPGTPLDRPAREWLRGPSDVLLDPAVPVRRGDDDEERDLRSANVQGLRREAAADIVNDDGGVGPAAGSMALALLGDVEMQDTGTDAMALNVSVGKVSTAGVDKRKASAKSQRNDKN
ncbi:putative serine/threonine-protein kinase iks1 [Geranomyces michiganensis]|nr:putative serine/threonine-protein kinase iks1 [Geranomyces michiganensis]